MSSAVDKNISLKRNIIIDNDWNVYVPFFRNTMEIVSKLYHRVSAQSKEQRKDAFETYTRRQVMLVLKKFKNIVDLQIQPY